MITEVIKVGQDGISSLRNHGFHHFTLIIGFCFTFNDFNRTFRAVADAGTKTIAEQIADQSCLTVNQLHGPFMTIGNADATSVAFLFINLNNFPFHIL